MQENTIENEFYNILNESPDITLSREIGTFDKLSSPYNRDLVLFGAGKLGQRTCNGLKRIGIELLAFCDNKKELWGKSICGVEVLSPAVAAEKFSQNATFVITIWGTNSTERYEQRKNQLLNLNCLRVIPFGILYWKYSDIFLPYKFLDKPQKILKNAQYIHKVFNLLADDESKKEYLAQLKLRVLMDFESMPSPVAHKQYFAFDLFSLIKDEVFVDCGAYNGDTIKDLINYRNSSFSQIIAIEPDPDNYEMLNNYVSSLSDPIKKKVLLMPFGVSDYHKKIKFNAMGTESSCVSKDGDIEIECIALDEALGQIQPTFIKMDIEGEELDALKGAQKIIKRKTPILTISLYHLIDDFWQIPLYINSLSDKYKFFLRPHDEAGWELVCYAVPLNRLKNI